MRIVVWALVLVACVSAAAGCGTQANHAIVPPENPTPLPDPSSRIEVGGSGNATGNSRPLER